MAAVQAAPGMPAASNKAVAAASSISPSQTLYIQQLPEKMRKPDLIRELYNLFSTHGHIIDIVAVKNAKMRGQAHVTFRDTAAAQQAMRAHQGIDFYGRNIKISYSKNRSQAFGKLTGEYVPPGKSQQAPTTMQQAHANTGIAPIPGMPSAPSTLPPPPGMPAQTNGTAAPANAKKRPRSQSPDRDVEMGGQEAKKKVESEEDSDAEMDVSDDSD